MKPAWIEKMNEEDLAFIKRFVLGSGSLKELATEYGVSYPTIRLRLDRLIEKICILDNLPAADEFELLAATLYAEGRLDEPVLRKLLDAHRRCLGQSTERRAI